MAFCWRVRCIFNAHSITITEDHRQAKIRTPGLVPFSPKFVEVSILSTSFIGVYFHNAFDSHLMVACLPKPLSSPR